MELDDKVCLCFHVTRRKLENFIRIEKPRRVAQLSDCFGAGTGCGWCRPFLQKLFEQSQNDACGPGELPSAAEYASQRTQYVDAGKGTPPPGATPLRRNSE
ncbi:bacterioferritin-associated ferredoxin [Planctomycetota bacterium]